MNFNRVLSTGGAGLIGSHLADELVRSSAAEIVVFDDFSRGRRENLRDASASGRVRVVEGDIRDPTAVDGVMQGVEIVFHEAGIRITQCAENPRFCHEVLVDGTFNVLEAAVRHRVRKVIAASSASVYGLATTFPTPEEHPPYANRTLYGAAKLFNEGLLRSFHDMHGLDYIALRYFNVYGPRMDVFGAYTEVLIRWMEAIDAGQPPRIFGDGLQTMDFIHVGDISRANVLAANSPLTDAVFNVGSGVETSLNDLVEMLLSVIGSSMRPVHEPPRKVNAVTRRQAGVDRAQEHLGFTSEISLEDGLRSLVAWWHEQRSSARG